jgi:SH3 domain protein
LHPFEDSMARPWVVLFYVLLASGAANAETRYISDKLGVQLRRGPSTEFLIVRNLDAGTAVELLEQDPANGYSKIRVGEQGTEGYILTRFLSSEPAARDKLAAAERSLTTARARVSELEEQVRALTQELGTAQTSLEDTRTSHDQVSKELSDIRTAAANVVEIRDQNESLRQRLATRDREVQELTTASRALASRSSQNWFIVGAGVLLGGFVIGLVAPNLRRKRRSNW